MKVLITGGAGFIGSHTADRLLQKGYDVKVLDSLEVPVHKNKPEYLDERIQLISGSVTDQNILLQAMKGVDYIFHFCCVSRLFTIFLKVC